MKKIVTVQLLLCIVLFSSCIDKKETQKENVSNSRIKSPSLELIWETDTLLTTSEAVLYDASSQIIYVANVNNAPWDKDDNGFISTINTKGEIINLKWIEGLSGPKGMGILNGKLYVNDIDRVVEIEIATKKVTNTYTIEDVPHLNDITTSDNAVYVSGSNSDAIYKIENSELNEIATDSLGRLNGLSYQKEGIYYATSSTHNFGIYSETNNTFKTLVNGVGHGDGVIKLENDDFIVSSWQGEIFYIHSKDWSKTQLLDTRAQKINAADIAYIPATKTLLVPTFFHNTVMAYKVITN